MAEKSGWPAGAVVVAARNIVNKNKPNEIKFHDVHVERGWRFIRSPWLPLTVLRFLLILLLLIQ